MAFPVRVFVSFEHTDLEQKDNFQSAKNSKLQHSDQYYLLYKDLSQPFLSVCLLWPVGGYPGLPVCLEGPWLPPPGSCRVVPSQSGSRSRPWDKTLAHWSHQTRHTKHQEQVRLQTLEDWRRKQQKSTELSLQGMRNALHHHHFCDSSHTLTSLVCVVWADRFPGSNLTKFKVFNFLRKELYHFLFL